MPFRISAKKAYGPGVFDMKAGIVQALFAYSALQKLNALPDKRIVFLWVSDEEIGSQSSRKLIEAEARRSDAVFVLEPSFGPRGLLKTARKAVGEAEIIVHGRASHAGLAPEEGINAIHELTHQISRITKWNDPQRGTTVNVDIIEGGTRTNVIADRARAVVDLRATRAADVQRIERQLHALKPHLPGARLEVRGGFSRAPLERKMSAALFKIAKSLAHQMNLPLGECAAGGGSDGNLTASLGIPTLDGLGAVGAGAHSTHEHILISAMPARAACRPPRPPSSPSLVLRGGNFHRSWQLAPAARPDLSSRLERPTFLSPSAPANEFCVPVRNPLFDLSAQQTQRSHRFYRPYVPRKNSAVDFITSP